MLALYGSNFSSPSNKVRFTLNALNIDYDYHQLDLLKGEQREAEFLKIAPAGRVPVIKDDDFVLFESNAICRYLAAKTNSPLYPESLRERAVVEQWIDFGSLHVGTAMARVLFNRVLAPLIKADVDEKSLKDGLSFLDKFLPVVEKQFTSSNFLASNSMTLADINLLAILDPAEACDLDLSKYEKLNAWRNSLRKKEFYTRCYADYSSMLNASS